jgi:Protein of unknown function (DUF3108)
VRTTLSPWFALCAASVACASGARAASFEVGERTAYEVSWLGLTAGRASITVGWPTERDGRQVWPLVCQGTSTGAASIFPVNDRFVSYWDPVAHRPQSADFFADENRQRRRERFTFDAVTHQATAMKQTQGRPPSSATFEMPDDATMDLASAAFSLREVPFAVGVEHALPVFTGVKIYTMKIKVEGKETLATRLGPLEVWRVSLNADFNGQLATRSRVTFFFTADARQLPVRAEADFTLGTVVLEVTEYAPGREGVP